MIALFNNRQEKTLKFPDGSVYKGEVLNNKPEGRGTRTWEHKEYVGEFRDGQQWGQGRYQIGKDWYEGLFYKGKFSKGKGVQICENQGRYEGDFLDSKRHGYGSFETETGDRYEGEWSEDVLHGKVTFKSIKLNKIVLVEFEKGSIVEK